MTTRPPGSPHSSPARRSPLRPCQYRMGSGVDGNRRPALTGPMMPGPAPPTKRRVVAARTAAIACYDCGMRVPPAGPLDLVVRGGRVVDPASGLDGRFDIGVRLGRIVAIEPDISEDVVGPPGDGSGLGTQVLDVSGSIVAPGF